MKPLPYLPQSKVAWLVAGLLCANISRASAAQLIWDPSQNGSGNAGSGNWDVTTGNTVWYNGTSDVLWAGTGTGNTPANGATFNGPDAAPGTYAISMDAVEIDLNSLIINNSGYTFSGANSIYLATSDTLSVAAGKTVTFNCNMAGSTASPFWQLGSGATMNVGGNLVAQQLRIAGPANSAVNLSGINNTPTILFILAPVSIASGTITAGNNFFIGYADPATINGIPTTAGSLTVSGSATVNENSGIFIVGRSFSSVGGQGTLTLQNGGAINVGTTKAENLDLCFDNHAANSAMVNVQGGILTVGASGFQASQIAFFATVTSLTGETAVLTQSGGTINAWGGIVLGLAGGTGTAAVTNSGGILYVGPNGITKGGSYTGPFNITLSGGSVGALGNWSSPLPMTLNTVNGNITFQCADSGSNPFNISLSGALTGAGGLNVSGSGTLTLSGANNYAGSTVVSNGTLAIVTGASPTNGPVTLDGSTGSPTNSVQSGPGQYWSIGTLTYASGTPTADFQFGALSPSTSVAPIQVAGNVVFSVTPNVSVGGSAIAVGTYPLIKYTGAISGTAPTSATLPGYVSAGYITNIAATKTIALVVTSSTYNPALSWRVGSGVWDINTTSNWTQFGSAAKYTDGNAVIFDDTASGPSPITVTLNTIVNPLAVTANNTTKNYIISGTGSITGSGSLQLLGGGTMTLNTTNSYGGGTIINSGQLNINNGGAISTGPLTNNAGAAIDNTSGSDVTVQASIPETWNGNFTYVGSANSFNTGPGQVTMNANTAITVNSNNFTVGGLINDNGSNFQLTKTGNGTLTLPVANYFAGGLTLSAGQLNLGDPTAAGYGVVTIVGGAIDNISGGPMTLIPISYIWSGNFSFLGSADLDLGSGTVVVPVGPGTVTVNVVTNTLTTEGNITSGNTPVIKSGNGTWNMTGPSTSGNNLGLIVNAGQVNFARTSGQAIGAGNIGLTVLANALAIDLDDFQIHSDSPSTPVPVVLSGGVWDLNGHKENVDKLSISGGGTLRNGASASTSTLTAISGFPAMLSGANCQFDVTAVDGNLNFNGVIAGSGSLVKLGAGVLNLNSNNTYTGNTTVSAGTLSLSFPCLANASTVTVATNALLQLNFTATNAVAALIINGVSRPPGIYNATTDPAYLGGTGSLLVGSPSISFSVNGNNLTLSWPNSAGWILQTNAINVSVGSDWYDVPGSATNTQLTVPATNPAVMNEFFRLRQP